MQWPLMTPWYLPNTIGFLINMEYSHAMYGYCKVNPLDILLLQGFLKADPLPNNLWCIFKLKVNHPYSKFKLPFFRYSVEIFTIWSLVTSNYIPPKAREFLLIAWVTHILCMRFLSYPSSLILFTRFSAWTLVSSNDLWPTKLCRHH